MAGAAMSRATAGRAAMTPAAAATSAAAAMTPAAAATSAAAAMTPAAAAASAAAAMSCELQALAKRRIVFFVEGRRRSPS